MSSARSIGVDMVVRRIKNNIRDKNTVERSYKILSNGKLADVPLATKLRAVETTAKVCNLWNNSIDTIALALEIFNDKNVFAIDEEESNELSRRILQSGLVESIIEVMKAYSGHKKLQEVSIRALAETFYAPENRDSDTLRDEMYGKGLPDLIYTAIRSFSESSDIIRNYGIFICYWSQCSDTPENPGTRLKLYGTPLNIALEAARVEYEKQDRGNPFNVDMWEKEQQTYNAFADHIADLLSSFPKLHEAMKADPRMGAILKVYRSKEHLSELTGEYCVDSIACFMR